MIRAFVLLLAFVLPAMLLGENCVVKGKVIDKATREPLAFSLIKVLNKKKEVVSGALTDVDGSYSINIAEPGKYTVTAQLLLYEPASSEVILRAGYFVVVDFVLEAMHLQLKDTVVYEVPPINPSGRSTVGPAYYPVKGTVKDFASGDPVPFAIVRVTGGNLDRATQADNKGNFSLELLVYDYLFYVQATGYQGEVLPFSVNPGTELRADFRLTGFSVHCPGTITISHDCRQSHKDSFACKTTITVNGDTLRKNPVSKKETDTLALSGVRSHGDPLAAAFLETGKLYRMNDSTFYFRYGFTRQTAVYRLHGETLDKIAWTCPAPATFTFRKTKAGWLIKSPGGAKARAE